MIICIGAFDGYHIGHQSLFKKAEEMSLAKGGEWRILTFHPHPRSVVGTTRSLLFLGEDKRALRKLFGIPQPIQVSFTLETANTEPYDFLEEVRAQLDIDGIVVGKNFRFGRKRSGDEAFLRNYCSTTGIELVVMPSKITPDGLTISSTRAREMVRNGDVAQAINLLSYPYFIKSEVIHGKGRGHKLGYPTANVITDEMKLVPHEGVYAGAMIIEGTPYPAAISVGKNPTFNDNLESPKIEAHAIGYSGKLYTEHPIVAFLNYMRPMIKFDSEYDLAKQLKVDCACAREIYDTNMDIVMSLVLPRNLCTDPQLANSLELPV